MGRPEKLNNPFFDHDTMHGVAVIGSVLLLLRLNQVQPKHLFIVHERHLSFLNPPPQLPIDFHSLALTTHYS